MVVLDCMGREVCRDDVGTRSSELIETLELDTEVGLIVLAGCVSTSEDVVVLDSTGREVCTDDVGTRCSELIKTLELDTEVG